MAKDTEPKKERSRRPPFERADVAELGNEAHRGVRRVHAGRREIARTMRRTSHE